MVKRAINIVWLKRDLRTQDHQALWQAEQEADDYLIIYLFEPSMIAYHDCSDRHLQFVYHSILEMNGTLKTHNRSVCVFYEEATNVFSHLNKKFSIKNVFSYRESGIQITWNRDKQMALFFKDHKINWVQYQRDGILRGVNNRLGWDKSWHTYVASPIIKNTFSQSTLSFVKKYANLPKSFLEKLENYPPNFQKPGESKAWAYLKSFCKDRGKNYSKYISKPTESRSSCGRISPYIAWGNINIKQAYQFVKSHENYPFNKRAFNGLLTRLKWHCHFIQKFEDECSYELECVNKGFEQMQYVDNPMFINAWKQGRTGFPLVDACMQCLKETGWINFRMRAMLVSVLCHHFDCDWKKGVYHLAKLFLDYEPGIHYTQFQMQAGTTGINTIRMYNPVKQSKDHDPKGLFIKKWIPTLQNVPEHAIHEPSKIPPMDALLFDYNFEYPKPIVDLDSAGKKARTKIWRFKKSKAVRQENIRIVSKHTRNNHKSK